MDEDPAEKAPGDDGSSDDTEVPASGEQPAALPTLEEQLEEASAEIARQKEKVLRVAADFDNYRKRTARELDDVRRRSRQAAVKDLLPVFDNLERATVHGEGADAASLAQGIRMVLKMFVDTLKRMGVERVETVGKPFDPTLHESIQYDTSDEHEAGIVMGEVQAGYRMGDELLRPALVMVSRGRPDRAPENAANGAAEPATEPSAETTPEPPETEESPDDPSEA